MQTRRWFVGVVVGTLVVLALAPAAAQAAAGPPTIISITPNVCGSAGGCKVIIRGTDLEELRVIQVGESPLKIVPTGIPTKGQCKLKSSTELECVVGFHEHGRVCFEITNFVGSTNVWLSPSYLSLPKRSRDWGRRMSRLWDGQIQLESPQIQTTIECVNVGFGGGWNIADETGEPIYGHGEILVWWASGHTPTAEHTELSSRCRFIYHGGTGEGDDVVDGLGECGSAAQARQPGSHRLRRTEQRGYSHHVRAKPNRFTKRSRAKSHAKV